MTEANGTPALFDNSILLSLTVHCIGNSAQGDLTSFNTGADKDRLRLNKTLLVSPELVKLGNVAQDIRKGVQKMCLGGSTEKFVDSEGRKRQVGKSLQSFVKSGVYFVPIKMVEKVDAFLKRMIPEFNNALEEFLAMYEARIEEAQMKLDDQFCESDYKSEEAVRRSCYIEYKYVSVGVPETLSRVKKELWEQEREKAKAQWAEATEEIRAVLAVGTKNLVDGMIEALKPGSDGKKKKFYDSTIDKMKEFLYDFPGRNIVQDQELAGLVDQIQDALKGKTADKLRKDSGLREEVSEKMVKIKESLDAVVEKVPSRVVEMED